MENYLDQLRHYLPIQFSDEEANDYITYLEGAYIENLKVEKYQFAFIAFHILNMIVIYKIKWFLSKQGNPDILSAIKNNKKISFNNLFDFSNFHEKESFRLLLNTLEFHGNDFKKCDNHVDARNQCSHASGKIEYDKKGIDFLIDDEIKYMERLQKKIEPELNKFLNQFLEEKWQLNYISKDFEDLFKEKYFSIKDLETISTTDLPLFKKKSNSEKNIKQKIRYLLLIFEIQKKIDADKNLFLDKLPILMIDLPKTISVEKDGYVEEITVDKIFEDYLIPIISNFPEEDRINSEKILKLGA